METNHSNKSEIQCNRLVTRVLEPMN